MDDPPSIFPLFQSAESRVPGRLIAVVGNAGVGKTTLARELGRRLSLTSGFEQHAERPFQALFARQLERYALANQVDYLLLRAEQELPIRLGGSLGVVDGGLDLDFHVFTRHFFRKGYLAESEYLLCQRLYAFIRTFLPPPDLILRMIAPLEIVSARYARRRRELEIARPEDLPALEALLEDWLSRESAAPVLAVEAGRDDPTYAQEIAALMPRLERLRAGME